jgi:hypothetical protein
MLIHVGIEMTCVEYGVVWGCEFGIKCSMAVESEVVGRMSTKKHSIFYSYMKPPLQFTSWGMFMGWMSSFHETL